MRRALWLLAMTADAVAAGMGYERSAIVAGKHMGALLVTAVAAAIGKARRRRAARAAATLLVATCWAAMGQVQHRNAIVLGPYADATYGPSSEAMNSGAKRLALGFNISHARTVEKVSVYVSAVAGTLNPGDLRCEIYGNSTDRTGRPDTLLAGVAASAAPTGPSVVEFTGFGVAVNGARQYWAVIRNMNAEPTTNYFTVHHSQMSKAFTYGGHSGLGWGKKVSLDGGATWSASNAGAVQAILVQFSDGAWDGALGHRVGGATTVPCRVRGTAEMGVRTRSPAVPIRVAGIQAPVYRGDSPASAVFFRLRAGGRTYETARLAASALPDGASAVVYFPAPVEIPAQTEFRVSLANDGADPAAGAFLALYEIEFPEGEPARQALTPWGGAWYAACFDGTAWTDQSGRLFQVQLLLDSERPFGRSGGGALAIGY